MQQLSVHNTTAPETSMQEQETSESSQEMTQEPSIEDLFYEQARRLEAEQRVDYYLRTEVDLSMFDPITQEEVLLYEQYAFTHNSKNRSLAT